MFILPGGKISYHVISLPAPPQTYMKIILWNQNYVLKVLFKIFLIKMCPEFKIKHY